VAGSSGRGDPVVLLVDDDEDTYNLYSDFLAMSGFSVVGANDGAEAVKVAGRVQPDLIIMDLGLPLLDGCAATRQLRADPRTRHIPIIAMTGYVQKHYLELAQEAGCDGFLAKPCPLSRLLDEARRLTASLSRARACVLLVEDDSEIRDSLGAVLEHGGYDVVGVANGLEALQKLREGLRPRLILLDLMMPVMDGWQFRHAQLEDPSLAKIPVVVLSALSGLRDPDSPSLVASEFLTKPVDVPSLLDTIGRFF
jgi:CheY-like chemotaxis protein